MITIGERADASAPFDADVMLAFELRQKSPLLTRLSRSGEAGVVPDRSSLLRCGGPATSRAAPSTSVTGIPVSEQLG